MLNPLFLVQQMRKFDGWHLYFHKCCCHTISLLNNSSTGTIRDLRSYWILDRNPIIRTMLSSIAKKSGSGACWHSVKEREMVKVWCLEVKLNAHSMSWKVKVFPTMSATNWGSSLSTWALTPTPCHIYILRPLVPLSVVVSITFCSWLREWSGEPKVPSASYDFLWISTRSLGVK